MPQIKPNLLTLNQCSHDDTAEKKSFLITFLLWLTLGTFGAHHLYLRRDRHAFVWFWTMGGCFGFGWLLEVWSLPAYVDAANGYGVHRPTQGPSVSWKRVAGEIAFGLFLGDLVLTAASENIALVHPIPILLLTFPFFVALGVFLVASIGEECCLYTNCLIGALLPVGGILLLVQNTSTASILLGSCIGSAVIANLTIFWKPVRNFRTEASILLRFCILSIFSLAVILTILAPAYVKITNSDPETEQNTPTDIIHHLASVPVMNHFQQTAFRFYQYFTDVFTASYRGIKQRLICRILDPYGTKNAYRTLGLTLGASEDDVVSHYRILVKHYHPDKYKPRDEEERELINGWFIDIQSAYELLSTKHQSRRHHQRQRENEWHENSGRKWENHDQKWKSEDGLELYESETCRPNSDAEMLQKLSDLICMCDYKSSPMTF